MPPAVYAVAAHLRASAPWSLSDFKTSMGWLEAVGVATLAVAAVVLGFSLAWFTRRWLLLVVAAALVGAALLLRALGLPLEVSVVVGPALVGAMALALALVLAVLSVVP